MRDSRGSDMPFFSNGIFLALIAGLLIFVMGDGIASSWKHAGGSAVPPTKIASR